MVLREYTNATGSTPSPRPTHHRHLPEQVARGPPSAELVVFRVADEHLTAAFSARYGFGLRTAPTPWSRAKRDGAEGYAAVVNLLAAARRNGAVKALLGARSAVLSPAREVATELDRHAVRRHHRVRLALEGSCRWSTRAV